MVQIVGVRPMEGTSKKSGKPYKGAIIHYCFMEDGTVGAAVDSEFASTMNGFVLPALQPGDYAEINHDRKGNIISIVKVQK